MTPAAGHEFLDAVTERHHGGIIDQRAEFPDQGLGLGSNVHGLDQVERAQQHTFALGELFEGRQQAVGGSARCFHGRTKSGDPADALEARRFLLQKHLGPRIAHVPEQALHLGDGFGILANAVIPRNPGHL